MDNLKGKAVHGVIWSAVESYSLQGVSFVLQLIMARLLTPHDYGLIGMLAIFMSLSQVFIDGGFSNALIQKKDKTEEDYCTVFYINIGVSIFFYLLLFFAAPWIASFFNQPLLSPITRIYSLNLIINSLVAVNGVKLTVAVDFKTKSKISLGAAVVSGIVGIICAYQGLGVWSLVIQMLLNAILKVILSVYYVRWFPKQAFSYKSFRSLFGYGSKLLASSIINSTYSHVYDLAIGKKFTSVDLGLYARGHQFAVFAGSNISSILQRVAFPILSEIQDDDKRLISAYRKFIKVATWASFPIVLGMCGIAKPMILTILTEKWADCIPYLQILCFSILWDCMILVNLNLLYVKGRSDLVLKLEIIKKTIAFGILAISLFFNLYIICLGKVVYSFIALYLNTYYTKKLLNYGFKEQLMEVLPQLFLSILMMLICLGIATIVQKPLLALFISFVIGSFFYILTSKIFHLFGFEELFSIIKRKLKC